MRPAAPAFMDEPPLERLRRICDELRVEGLVRQPMLSGVDLPSLRCLEGGGERCQDLGPPLVVVANR